MQELKITKNESGQRMDKVVSKYLNQAPASFIYKMLRKKNIVLNGKKASGKEKLILDDVIQFFLADETIEKFSNVKIQKTKQVTLDIVYEDENVVFINKPVGMLSQKANPSDESVNEYLIQYLLASNAITGEELRSFRPAVCNRLDRNTSGLILAGKTMEGLQGLSMMLKDRTMKKYYRCLVKGNVNKDMYVAGWLVKDEKTNKVIVHNAKERMSEEEKRIETSYHVIWNTDEVSFLEVHLITGRAHQIRAHLASIGHPIIGDHKYGEVKINTAYKERFGLKSQLLHAYRIQMPRLEKGLETLSQKEFCARLPKQFQTICDNACKAGKG